MSNKYKGKLFLIVGPSGVGKSVIIALLRENYPDFIFPVTATTRAPRPTEKDGVHYHFLSKEEFERKIVAGEFLEYAHVHGDNYYGVLKKSVLPYLERGSNLLREVDIQGVRTLHRDFDGDHLISIFLLPPSRAVLEKRIRQRAPISDAELEERFRSLEKEVLGAQDCTYQVKFEDDETIQECYQKVEKVILQEIKS